MAIGVRRHPSGCNRRREQPPCLFYKPMQAATIEWLKQSTHSCLFILFLLSNFWLRIFRLSTSISRSNIESLLLREIFLKLRTFGANPFLRNGYKAYSDGLIPTGAEVACLLFGRLCTWFGAITIVIDCLTNIPYSFKYEKFPRQSILSLFGLNQPHSRPGARTAGYVPAACFL